MKPIEAADGKPEDVRQAREPATERPWRGLSRPERDIQRRHRLLDAGLELFGTVGYAATTVQGLCREAEVSSRSFYHYFSGREELLETVYVLATREIQHRIARLRIASGETADHVILRGVQAGIGPMLEDQRLGRVVEIEAVGVSPALEARRREMIGRIAQAVDAMLAELMRRGLIPEFRTGMMGLMIVGGMTEALVAHLSGPGADRAAVGDFSAEMARIIVRMAGA